MNNQKITVQLDTVRKYRNSIEYRPIGRARSDGYEVVGEGAFIRSMLKNMYADGAPIEATVQVFRGDTLCFRPMPLKSWVIPGKNPIKKRQNESSG